VQTDRTIRNIKPEIIIHGNEQGTCMFTDSAVSGGRNVIKKEGERIPKYEDLKIETQRKWNIKAKVKRVIIRQLTPYQYHSDNT
jgi:hypothetical protein